VLAAMRLLAVTLTNKSVTQPSLPFGWSRLRIRALELTPRLTGDPKQQVETADNADPDNIA
jgi:hypothetical protein